MLECDWLSFLGRLFALFNCGKYVNKLVAPKIHLFYRKIDDVDKTMNEINEQTENIKQIQEALTTPIGSAADFDEVPCISLIIIIPSSLYLYSL